MSWLDFNDVASPALSMPPRCDAQQLKMQLLERLPDALSHLFPNGKVRGAQFFIGDLQGNPGKSLVVELAGPKMGVWIDFETNESGDVLSLWAAVKGLDAQGQFPELKRSITHWLGNTDTVDGRHEQRQVERGKSAPVMDDLGPYTAKWDYLNANRELIACVYRYDPPSGKEYRPWDARARAWRAPDSRPLYNQPGIAQTDRVVLVEGEKCAQALIDAGICATTAMNGAKAPVGKTDWSPMSGKHVVIWPDCDRPGWEYAESVAPACVKAGATSVAILVPSPDKPEKWDAADAIAEGFDMEGFVTHGERRIIKATPHRLPSYTLGELLDDDAPVPPDLIAPRVLTPAGTLVFGGAPKVGKSDFLLAWLTHMAAGASFLGMTPARPLRVFYLQAEVQYHYLRERVKALRLPSHRMVEARKNFVATPQLRLVLDEGGLAQVIPAITNAFGPEGPDIIAIDPIRNLFDGGEAGGENDNGAMLFFLSQRVERLRQTVNPNAGIILAHHTRKLGKRQLEEDPFQALAGAGSLRGYYSTGMLLFRPDEANSVRQMYFELRNGAHIPPKYVDKLEGEWREVSSSERLVMKDYGERLDAERRRKRDNILQILFEEAAKGKCYTANQFAESFEGVAGLGANRTINERLSVLATKGYIKFFRNPEDYGLPAVGRSKFGYMCVEGMALLGGPTSAGADEDVLAGAAVRPTHYKCPKTGSLLPVENPEIWVYHEELAP
ncbi:AAA family ATPase [Hahella sp. CR1]|uniref:AAA family ATPase n=1 Tax=Hahella sp. CR1 TaxID=2992807 RepID=UPI002441F509|nr:AAA family ATPase [Hahella sp. CR1]MDG9672082.1 AAA family ATPase [Hahella sp. CR1]